MRLDWAGMTNARDLGGIPLRSGGRTRPGAFVRSDHPSRLTGEGWRQLDEFGIRTIVSLETGGLQGEEDARSNREVLIPDYLDQLVVRLPVEDGADDDFLHRWARTGLWGTPLYFADALERWPRLYGDALRAIAALDGGILLHCGRGHDRTGIMTLLLLTLAGATVEGIVDDYLVSVTNQRSRDPRGAELFDRAMSRAGTTVHDAMATAIAVVDDAWLVRAGVTSATVEAIRGALAD